jgi:hypothetical protein
MNSRTIRSRFLSCLVVAALLPCVLQSAVAAESRSRDSGRSSDKDLELSEVVVSGAHIKADRNPQNIVNWLKRLVGQFRYTGFVQLSGDGVSPLLLVVDGGSDCRAFGRAPGVHCELNVRWPETRGGEGQEVPGGISTLTPAMVEYGLDSDHLGIRFMQVDSKGYADSGQAYLVGDTLTTTMPCVGLGENCQRVTRINAHPDLKIIEMQVEIEKDSERRARLRFVLNRVGPPP